MEHQRIGEGPVLSSMSRMRAPIAPLVTAAGVGQVFGDVLPTDGVHGPQIAADDKPGLEAVLPSVSVERLVGERRPQPWSRKVRSK